MFSCFSALSRGAATDVLILVHCHRTVAHVWSGNTTSIYQVVKEGKKKRNLVSSDFKLTYKGGTLYSVQVDWKFSIKHIKEECKRIQGEAGLGWIQVLCYCSFQHYPAWPNKNKQTNKTNEWINKKDLGCYYSVFSHQNVEVCCAAQSGKTKEPYDRAEGSGLLSDGHSIVNSFTNIELKHTTDALFYSLKRVCQKPRRVSWMDEWGGWVPMCGCQISQPRTKGGFKSFAHLILTRTESSVYWVWLYCNLGWDITAVNLLATKPVK